MQTSIVRYARIGVNMAQQRRPGGTETNGVVTIDLEAGGFSRNVDVFRSVHGKLREKYKNKELSKDYTKKQFAVRGQIEFSWLYLRENNADGVFDPAWLCKPCNTFYAENNYIRIHQKNTFVYLNKMLENGPQKSGLKRHGQSHGHGMAIGAAATPADRTVFDATYYKGYFGIELVIVALMLYLVINQHQLQMNTLCDILIIVMMLLMMMMMMKMMIKMVKIQIIKEG